MNWEARALSLCDERWVVHTLDEERLETKVDQESIHFLLAKIISNKGIFGHYIWSF
jgi:hypothetical protein